MKLDIKSTPSFLPKIIVNTKLEIWTDALECKGYRLSKTKIENMECNFSKNINKDELVVQQWKINLLLLHKFICSRLILWGSRMKSN